MYFEISNENTESFVKQKEIISSTNLTHIFFSGSLKYAPILKELLQRFFKDKSHAVCTQILCSQKLECINSQFNKYPLIQVTSKSEHFRDAAIMDGTIVRKLTKTSNSTFQ